MKVPQEVFRGLAVTKVCDRVAVVGGREEREPVDGSSLRPVWWRSTLTRKTTLFQWEERPLTPLEVGSQSLVLLYSLLSRSQLMHHLESKSELRARHTSFRAQGEQRKARTLP